MKLFWQSLLLATLPMALGAADVQKMFATRVEIPERGEVSGYLCVLGTNKYSFIGPGGWKPEAKLDRREVVFISPELDASLTFKVQEGIGAAGGKDSHEAVLQRFPNATIVDEFNCYAADQIGRGYVLDQKAADKGKVKIRYGIIAVPGGTAEFILRAPGVRMPDLHLLYGRFLASFRVETHRPRS
ncbi:MAG TPA: hypothetical protein VJ063_11220 [Verrucomicrobiae bacterium]|nr:hypothetical protein [Verrucomicrobiae bacterium]